VWLGVVGALVATGAYLRPQPAQSVEPTTETPVLREVSVITPQPTARGEVTLPATVHAYQATDLFARANGFLKTWNYEIGAAVKQGDVLVEIETPELDQELAQAIALHKQGEAELQQSQAELEEAKSDVVLAEATIVKVQANLDFSISQSHRYEKLIATKSVSREDYENVIRDRDAQKADLEVAKADLARRRTNLSTRQSIIASHEAVVRNREANVQRLRELTGFQRIVAPFDGIVTRRNAEVGMLVTSGSNTGTQPLYSIAQVDTLRVQASVPQSSALGINAGSQANIVIPERPGHAYSGRVARTAGAVEPNSRSLLVEIELPNGDGQLLPGMYAQVRFESQQAEQSWVVPVKVLQMRTTGAHVLAVDHDGSVSRRKVRIGRDYGATVEVLVGLNGDERLVVNPTDDLREGEIVQVKSSDVTTADARR
jgi:RND family efflux transporter MFP subunit